MRPAPKPHFRKFVFLCVTLSVCAATLIDLGGSSAQTAGPILISQPDSTRAIAFDSVTQHREPFSSLSPVRFGADNHSRIMLFAMNVTLTADSTAGDFTADAEDAAHVIYQLPVEYVGAV